MRRGYACGRVAYARDAFDGLHLMDKVIGNGFDDYLAAVQARRAARARNTYRTLGQADARAFRPVDVRCVQMRRGGDAGCSGGGAAVLGRARDRGIAEGDRAVRE